MIENILTDVSTDKYAVSDEITGNSKSVRTQPIKAIDDSDDNKLRKVFQCKFGRHKKSVSENIKSYID